VSKKRANVALIGLITEEKHFEMNGVHRDQPKPLPYLWKKTKAVGANTDCGHRSRLVNAFRPNFDRSWEKGSAGWDGEAVNTAQSPTEKIFICTAWKDVPASDSDTVNSISQFMFDGESSSDDEDIE
jgi:hypothetical protein